jgi:hypothetical protein
MHDRGASQAFAVAAVGSVWLVWRLMFAIASSFLGMSQAMAEWGFMVSHNGAACLERVVERVAYSLPPKQQPTPHD